MAKTWLIYGANGYTGRLIAAEAVKRGLQPVLAGRNRHEVAMVAAADGLEVRDFDLKDPDLLRRALADIDLVLHCAGPYGRTGAPMMAACIAEGCHYLDLSGEIDVFAHAHSLDSNATAAGVLLLPGVGFDVVPTDCLSACLAERLPDATHLYLAFEGQGGVSPGTARSSIEGLSKGGRVRRRGELVRVPLGYHHRSVDFGNRVRSVVTIPWGDVYTAYVTTGIPNIEVYMSVSRRTVQRLQRLRWLGPFVGLRPVRRWIENYVRRAIPGPDEKRRKTTNSFIWGEVRNEAGTVATGRMLTPNSYDLTVLAALGIVERLLGDDPVPVGFHTPSQAMGKDYAASLPGVLVTMS